MGLAAFNRAREKQAREQERILQVERKRQDEQRLLDMAAAVVVCGRIACFDTDSPYYVRDVAEARIAYNALTPPQKAQVNEYGQLEAAEAALPAALAVIEADLAELTKKLEAAEAALSERQEVNSDGQPKDTQNGGGAAEDGTDEQIKPPDAPPADGGGTSARRRGGG